MVKRLSPLTREPNSRESPPRGVAMSTSFCRIVARSGLLLLAVLMLMEQREAAAGPCISDGGSCRTNTSCCGRLCYNSQPPGKRVQGKCCLPTTCAAQGAECGIIPNGTCYQVAGLTLACPDCPAGKVCNANNLCETTTTSTSTSTTSTSTSSSTTTTLCT